MFEKHGIKMAVPAPYDGKYPKIVSCFEKIPFLGSNEKLRNCIRNDKVIGLALEALKTLVSAIIGVTLGAMLCTPIGTTMIIVGACVGGGIGAITYIAVRSVVHAIKTRGYPAHPYRTEKPIGGHKLWHYDESYEYFKDVFKAHFKDQEWFVAWKDAVNKKIDQEIADSDFWNFSLYKSFKNRKKIQSDSDAASKLFSRGANANDFFAEAQLLVKESKLNPEAKRDEFLRKIKREEVFHRQVLEIIRKDLAQMGEDKHAETVAALVKEIPNVQHVTTAEITFDRSFRKTLKEAMKNGRAATLHLTHEKSNHTLFLELGKDSYRFYDPYSNLFGGLHEKFKDEREFISALYKNLRGYRAKWRQCPRFEGGTLQVYT